MTLRANPSKASEEYRFVGDSNVYVYENPFAPGRFGVAVLGTAPHWYTDKAAAEAAAYKLAGYAFAYGAQPVDARTVSDVTHVGAAIAATYAPTPQAARAIIADAGDEARVVAVEPAMLAAEPVDVASPSTPARSKRSPAKPTAVGIGLGVAALGLLKLLRGKKRGRRR